MVPYRLPSTTTGVTISGTYSPKFAVDLQEMILPEFSRTRKIDYIRANVFEQASCPYDIILGRDFLIQAVLTTDLKMVLFNGEN